jgi:hypothetical protein
MTARCSAGLRWLAWHRCTAANGSPILNLIGAGLIYSMPRALRRPPGTRESPRRSDMTCWLAPETHLQPMSPRPRGLRRV